MKRTSATVLTGIFAAFALVGVVVGWQVLNRALQAPDGTASDGPPAASLQVRLGTFSSAIDYGPFFVARSKGWIAEELALVNATPSYTQFETLPSINEAFAAEDIDVIFEAEPPAIVGRAAGLDIRIVGISCTLRQEVIANASLGVDSVAALKGRRIAVLAGTSSHYGLLQSLANAGLTAGDVQILDMIPPDAKAAFAKSDVDAWAVWPPWVEQEIIAKTAATVPGSEAVIQSIVVARGKFVDEHPGAARAVASSITRAKQWMIENPGEAQAVLATELNIPLEVVTLAWSKHDWSARVDAEIIADVQRKADFLLNDGRITASVDASALIRPLQ
jgi:sulfonate transport system substrate-binding protein